MKKNERMKLAFLLVACLACSFTTVLALHGGTDIACISDGSMDLSTTANYIEIDGNAELAANASSGHGNSTHPYVLENYFVGYLGRDGITIKNTDAHFVLRNCTAYEVAGQYKGINLDNVTNANVTNNTVSNSGFGIFLLDTFNSSVSNNSLHHDSKGGIFIHDSINVTIDGNTIFIISGTPGIETDNITWSNISRNNLTETGGLNMNDGGNNTITNNLIYDSYYYGIQLFEECQSNFTKNTLINNAEHGLYLLSESHNNIIKNNTINENDKSGIAVRESDENMIQNNTINNNTEAGVLLQDSDYNIVQNNTIWDNGICISVTGTSTGNTITPNSCAQPDDGSPTTPSPPPPPIPGFSIVLVVPSLMAAIFVIQKRRIQRA